MESHRGSQTGGHLQEEPGRLLPGTASGCHPRLRLCEWPSGGHGRPTCLHKAEGDKGVRQVAKASGMLHVGA